MTNADIIGGYYCEKLQHWVKVIKPTRDTHKPRTHSKTTFRMKGSERKKEYEPTMEELLKQKIARFLAKREENLEKT